MVCVGRENGKPAFYFFDKDWNFKNIDKDNPVLPAKGVNKPKNLSKMIEIAETLSKGFSFVRVDLYYSKGKIYFGELTFYPDSGFDATLLEKTDILLGDKININK